MSKNKKNNAYDKIREIIKHLDFKDDDYSLFKISCKDSFYNSLGVDDIDLLQEKFWFLLDDEENLRTAFSAELFLEILQKCKRIEDENFELKLERAIWKNIPVDFEDVRAVAISKAKKIRFSDQVDLNIENLIMNIKEEYPNLFVNMREIMKHRGVLND